MSSLEVTQGKRASNAQYPRVRLGSAPDSWGVWFPDDPQQTPWPRFLDELAAAGYQWLELGPYGYLPTDPAQLADELAARGLRLSGGTVAGSLHRSDTFNDDLEHARRVAGLIKAMGARHLVYLPEMYRDPVTGDQLCPAELEPEAWRTLVDGASELGKILFEDLGIALAFHPHADSHVATQQQVQRFLDDTDPAFVALCLDTGHVAYCGGDSLALIVRYPERIGYLHLKQVDRAVLARVQAEGLSFGEAVRLGAMCEPPGGIPDLEQLVARVGTLDADLFAIVEQDLYPCDPDKPLPIATRTREYLGTCGLGPGSGRPPS